MPSVVTSSENAAVAEPDSAVLPLAGIRVVEFGQYIAVPGAAQILLDQGATVIKVEPPGGEACRNLAGLGPAMFNAYNRGKRMVEVDLGDTEGQHHVRELVKEADLVLSNMKPGALERYGLAPDSLRQENPRLVVVTLTGFGDTGPMRKRPGLDIAAQAESGIMWVTGEAEGEPQRVGFPVVDAAAATTIAQAATSALLRQALTGDGGHIRLSLWDVAIHLQATNWMDWFISGNEPARKGNGQPSAAPAADLVKTQDGFIVVSAYMPHQWSALCNAIGRTELIADPRFCSSTERVVHRKALHAELAKGLAHLTRAAAVELLASAGVVAGSIQDYPDAYGARNQLPGSIFVDAAFDGRQMPYIGTPLQWSGAVPHADQPRRLGADNALFDQPQADRWSAAALHNHTR